jgi:transposase
MGYSTDLRETVLNFIETGNSIKTACKLFAVSRSSIQRWRLRLSEGAPLGPKPRIKSPYKVDAAALSAYISDHPDAYLNEIAAHFNVTDSGISKALSRLKITRKKKRRSMQKEMKPKGSNL